MGVTMIVTASVWKLDKNIYEHMNSTSTEGQKAHMGMNCSRCESRFCSRQHGVQLKSDDSSQG